MLNDTNTDIPKLTVNFDRLTSSNIEVLSIDASIQEHIPVDQLEAEYNDRAMGMMAELRCQIAALELTKRAPVSSFCSTSCTTND